VEAILHTCKLLALTQIGGRSSSIKENTLSMVQNPTNQFKFTKTRILKDKRSFAQLRIMAGTRDGELSILIKLPRRELRAMIENTDSTSIDFSTSDQDFHSGELLQLSELILNSRDTMLQERDTSNGNSIESPILSSLTTPEATQ
jgi:hypothetical protein